MNKYIWYRLKTGKNTFVNLNNVESFSILVERENSTLPRLAFYVLYINSSDSNYGSLYLKDVSERIYKAHGEDGLKQFADLLSLDIVGFLDIECDLTILNLQQTIINCENKINKTKEEK